MKEFAIKTAVNAVALWVAAWAIQGIHLGESDDTGKNILTIVLVAAIFGVINAFVRPFVTFLSIPAILITLGLFIFIVNALMLGLTSWIATQIGLAFSIDDFFWSTIWGSLIVSAVSWFINAMIVENE